MSKIRGNTQIMPGTITNTEIQDTTIALAKLVEGSVLAKTSGFTMTAAIAMGTNKITGLGTPTADTDAATKLYVDNAIQGLDVKQSVRAASTANVALNAIGATMDGVALAVDNRILIKNQTLPQENGIYLFKGAAVQAQRVDDMSVWAEVPGAFVFVEEGTTQANSGWTCTADQGGTIGTTAMAWSQFSGAGTYQAGSGLTLTGSSFSVNTDGSTLEINGGNLRVKALGIATGHIADDAVNAAKLNADTAGAGLVQNASGALDVGAGTGITVNANDIAVIFGTSANQAAHGNHNHTIDGLSNVVITSNSDGELLVWDTSTSKWINQTLAEAGISATHTHPYRPDTWTPVTQTITDGATATSPSEDALFHALAGKEPTFTKNTAFNKNFGTSAGTTAEGNHNHTIDALSNVVITNNTDGELLVWDTTTGKWINQTLAEAGISATHSHPYRPDTWTPVYDGIRDAQTATSPSENAVFDALALKSDTSHSHTLDGLSDVAIAGGANGDVLVYNTVAGWANKSLANAGIATSGHNHDTAYLGINAKAADSNLLDGLDSTAFAAAVHNHDATIDTKIQEIGHASLGTATAGQTSWILGYTPMKIIMVMVNGLPLLPSEWSISGDTITTPACVAGDNVSILQYHHDS